jgi:hypothetical protein
VRRKLFFTGIVVAMLLLAALGASISLARGARARLRALAPRRRETAGLTLETSATHTS